MLNIAGLGVNIFPPSGSQSEQPPPVPPSYTDRASSASLKDARETATANSLLLGGSTSSNQEQAFAANEQTTSTGRHSTIIRPAERAPESMFSRHDSLFSFGVTSARNAAELKSFLGNSSSRLKPGATVLPLQAQSPNGRANGCNAVFLEQAKTRARVEVDIVLENDCCVEGGYLRGNIKIRVRRRQKREAPLLLADGKIRVIGFESIPGVSDRHAFYQRASPLCAATDTSASIYNTPPDAEGFAHVMEGVHVLPFAMHLPVDGESGAPKGSPVLQNGAAVRYIAMISVKVKDSKTGKRSIAHFYRDCQVWPCLDLTTVLASAPRHIQASTARSLSVIGGGHKVKLTAILHRLTHVAGQRCYVRVSVVNETKKSVKTLALTLIRTTILFKPKPALDYSGHSSADPDACQTTTSHKVVAESILERSQGVTKGHASAEGWWTGVSAGQEAQFAHYVLIPPDALSVTRARLIEVEYSIRVSLGAGALTSDVQVTLPVRIVNFLSLDPIPSAPLVSSDGSYARLVPQYDTDEEISPSVNSLSAGKSTSACPSIGRAGAAAGLPSICNNVPSDGPTTDADHGPVEADSNQGGEGGLRPRGSALQVVNPDSTMGQTSSDWGQSSVLHHASDSDNSLYSMASYASSISSSAASSPREPSRLSATCGLGNIDLPEDASSDDDFVNLVLRSTQQDPPALSASTDSFKICRTTVGAPDLPSDESTHPSTGVALTNNHFAPSCSPNPQPASLRSSHIRPAGPRRFASTVACEPQTHTDTSPVSRPPDQHGSGAHTLTEVVLARSAFVSPSVVPVRPERSPLRAHTGPGARDLAGAQGSARTSFERRVREKKQALLEAQAARALRDPSQHVGDYGTSGDVGDSQAHSQDTDDDGDDTTPRLGYTISEERRAGAPAQCFGLAMGTPAEGKLLADTGSSCPPGRPSRQLPLPPPRPSYISSSSSSGLEVASSAGGIPESVSALEALRASQLCGGSMSSGSVRRALRPQGSRLLVEPSGISAPPPLVLSSSSSSSAHSASSQGSQAFGALSNSFTDVCNARPTEGLYCVGMSDNSVVKGRIAAFEERLKMSQEIGAAYT